MGSVTFLQIGIDGNRHRTKTVVVPNNMNTTTASPALKMSDVLSRLLAKQEKRQIQNQRRIAAAENLRDSAFFRSTPADRASDTLREVR